MCYRAVSHMMRCDARPLLSDGQAKIVDSYGQPRACECRRDADIKRWLRCEHHGCCRAAAKTYLCVDPGSCKGTVLFHGYEQVPTPRGARAAGDMEGHDQDDDERENAWPARLVLDRGRFPHRGQVPGTRLRFEAPVLRRGLEALRRTGRRIDELESMVARWRDDAFRLQAEHHDDDDDDKIDHLRSVIKLLRAAIRRSAGQKRVLVDEFAKARGALLMLEGWGERAVTGLDEGLDEGLYEDEVEDDEATLVAPSEGQGGRGIAGEMRTVACPTPGLHARAVV
ncbi:hypothetical protein G6O67_008035 [Ophiocordyceps sinensis]|uniref:Uncharacterized protein n=2 Tax=Ophiocordyceps sinensis TaxID=72228 RepID=A0A8H4LTG0_9HYPO|nr:hypothetical protein OCS_03413 [Ophiocordyceps sinensis CO18]KAF4504602.1 hypothetical protein G6O67_008035 [Ophiocordyceps sinensis]